MCEGILMRCNLYLPFQEVPARFLPHLLVGIVRVLACIMHGVVWE